MSAEPALEIARVSLRAPAGRLGELLDFYCGRLGMADTDGSLAVGRSALRFVEAEDTGQPFYHFAFLAPGDRFAAAHRWLDERVPLLPGGDGADTVFDFPAWDAQACYFHDPAGNIVELIAHRALGVTPGRSGAFSAGELLGLSEIGLVVPSPSATASELTERLGLAQWEGPIDREDGLGFIGAKASTLILAPIGRGWMPTGRPAESHPVHALLRGTRTGALQPAGTPHLIEGGA